MNTRKYSFSKESIESLRELNNIINQKSVEMNALNLLMQGIAQSEYQRLGIYPTPANFTRKVTPDIIKNEIIVEDTPKIIVPGQN